MKLHQRVIGQAQGCRLQIGQGLGKIAPAVFDPAIGVLKRRNLQPAQPAGHGKGPFERGGIIAVRGNHAGQVVGKDHIAAVAGIKCLVDRNRAVDIAVLFQQTGLEQVQRRGPRLACQTGIDHGGRRVGPPG